MVRNEKRTIEDMKQYKQLYEEAAVDLDRGLVLHSVKLSIHIEFKSFCKSIHLNVSTAYKLIKYAKEVEGSKLILPNTYNKYHILKGYTLIQKSRWYNKVCIVYGSTNPSIKQIKDYSTRGKNKQVISYTYKEFMSLSNTTQKKYSLISYQYKKWYKDLIVSNIQEICTLAKFNKYEIEAIHYYLVDGVLDLNIKPRKLDNTSIVDRLSTHKKEIDNGIYNKEVKGLIRQLIDTSSSYYDEQEELKERYVEAYKLIHYPLSTDSSEVAPAGQ